MPALPIPTRDGARTEWFGLNLRRRPDGATHAVQRDLAKAAHRSSAMIWRRDIRLSNFALDAAPFLGPVMGKIVGFGSDEDRV